MSTAATAPPKAMHTIRFGRALSSYAAGVVGFMVLVIVEGAVVRATGSGAGCGDHWPLCNGQILPHHPRLATVIEFTHRSLTGVCTGLVAGLIAATVWLRPRGHRARYAAVFTGVLLVVEGALGAVLVKGHYVEKNASDMRVFMQGIHFTNTMLLLAAMTLTWWWLGKRAVPAAVSPRVRWAAWVAVVCTLLVGATGAIAALADTLFPSSSLQAGLLQDFAANSPLLVRMRWLHPAAAIVGLVCAIVLCRMLRGAIAGTLLFLIAAQFVLGVADVLLLAPTWMQVLHLLGADLYWIALIAACASVLAPSGVELTGA
jgi:cytochrome c oxidase assembly protein subunit 15